MTSNTTMPAPFAEGDFRVGRVLHQSASVFRRNFPSLFLVGAIAYLPMQLLYLWAAILLLERTPSAGMISPSQIIIVFLLFMFVAIVFNLLSQAIILHVAFQDMRSRSADIVAALKVGLRQSFPILMLGICIGISMMLALWGLGAAVSATMSISGNPTSSFVVTILAALLGLAALAILYTMWFVAIAACVADRLGPLSALRRSAQLTKGYRWRIIGLLLLLFVVSSIVSFIIGLLVSPLESTVLTFLGNLGWSAVWGAYYATAVAVAYHDLRVAKEGIEEIASVFD